MDAPRSSEYGYELPSARKVSLKVSQGISNPDNVRSFLFTVFGEFLDHDLTLSPLSVLTVNDPTGNSFMVYLLRLLVLTLWFCVQGEKPKISQTNQQWLSIDS